MKIFVNEIIFNEYRRKRLSEEVDLSSFEMKETLCPDIFSEENKMHPEIRKKLLKVAQDFYDSCNIEWVDIEDIILTGSLANYNWSNFSDVDLHVLVDYNEISKNTDLAEEFAWSKKKIWNDAHDVYIKKYPVEMYLQNTEEELVAGGVYSVLYDKWIRFPEKFDVNFDESLINKIVGFFLGKFNSLKKKFEMGNYDGLFDEIDAIKRLLSQMRKKGLKNKGEFSAENIAFKSLRRSGILDSLDSMKSEIYDSENSFGKIEEPVVRKPVAEPEQEKEEDKDIVPGQGRYFILGKRYSSLRQAEKKLGIPKSTLQYRVKSDNPEFSQYRELDEF